MLLELPLAVVLVLPAEPVVVADWLPVPDGLLPVPSVLLALLALVVAPPADPDVVAA